MLRKTGLKDLVLFNRAVIAEAEAACARSREVRFASLLNSIGWLISGTMILPWGCNRYPGYWDLADGASALGVRH